ncbi:MAG: threonine aldolase [Bdellovibrionales bacterium]|nr:threonine aldolase [Bdellovibrionales bacterium]
MHQVEPRSKPQFDFGSDNYATIHPEVLETIAQVNVGHAPAYGLDFVTAEVRELFKKIFNHPVQTYFVFNGSAANVLSLRALLQPHEAVIATDVSHIQNDECGAPEFHGGNKIITLPSQEGKLTPALIEPILIRLGDQHCVQPRLVSITQPTELGTVYSIQELKQLSSFCKKNQLLLHMDGARLGNAVCFLNSSFQEMTTDVKLDALSLGGTKNGLLGAEAILFFNHQNIEAKNYHRSSVPAHFKFIQKQELQLPSKVRFLAAQFKAYFQNELWRRMAQKSLSLTQELAQALQNIPEISIQYPVQSNAVFAQLPKSWVKPLKETCFFYIWDEKKFVARFMLSHDNQSADIKRFIETIQQLQKKNTR